MGFPQSCMDERNQDGAYSRAVDCYPNYMYMHGIPVENRDPVVYGLSSTAVCAFHETIFNVPVV
ncbi:hypothetical protein MHBO_004798 [Bonamia ostreae]|uniref:Uncharacterized protein n=1 Tax=Bonamia ostreae TaxID=126728 RepID=A0ABV2AU99_9EUKA